MSEKWYPDIDYMACTQCGACVERCEHGVYNKSKAPTPVVIFPEGCVQGCKCCANLCPDNAIRYVGNIDNHDSCGCSDSCCG